MKSLSRFCHIKAYLRSGVFVEGCRCCSCFSTNTEIDSEIFAIESVKESFSVRGLFFTCTTEENHKSWTQFERHKPYTHIRIIRFRAGQFCNGKSRTASDSFNGILCVTIDLITTNCWCSIDLNNDLLHWIAAVAENCLPAAIIMKKHWCHKWHGIFKFPIRFDLFFVSFVGTVNGFYLKLFLKPISECVS